MSIPIKPNYGSLKTTRVQLRREALAEALQQARSDAAVIGVKLLGVYQLSEDNRSRDINQEYISDIAGDSGVRSRGTPEIGLPFGNSTTVTLDLRAEFRVTPFADAAMADATVR